MQKSISLTLPRAIEDRSEAASALDIVDVFSSESISGCSISAPGTAMETTVRQSVLIPAALEGSKYSPLRQSAERYLKGPVAASLFEVQHSLGETSPTSIRTRTPSASPWILLLNAKASRMLYGSKKWQVSVSVS
jgi:hypothetical protein